MRAFIFVALLWASVLAALPMSSAQAHESSLSCSADTAKQPLIESGRVEVKQKPKSTAARMHLADLLIGAGCYDEAVHVLEDGVKLSPNDRNLQTRLRTAKSFIGEREYLEQHPAVAAEGDAIFLRAQLRCKQVGDVQACDQALSIKPNDAALWIAKGDGLLKEQRSRDALLAFNRAKQLNSGAQGPELDVTSRIGAAQALLAVQSPPAIAQRRVTQSNAVPVMPKPTTKVAQTYSNIEPATRSN